MRKLIVFLLTLCVTSFSQSQTPWKHKKTDNDITIYTRSIPSKKLDEYKAVTIIDTAIENVIKELVTAPKYYENCVSGISYHVKKLKKNQHVFYAHKDLPLSLIHI